MKTVGEVIEDIQQAHVDAGGCFIRQKEIREMKVGDLLDSLIPNNILFEVVYVDKKEF